MKVSTMSINGDGEQRIIADQHEPYYHSQLVSVINGDSTDSTLFNEPFADLIVTSPPYDINIDYGNTCSDSLTHESYLMFSETWIKNIYSWSNTQARFVLNIPIDTSKNGQCSLGADLTCLAQDCGWKYKTTIVWNEGNISNRLAWGSFASASSPNVICPTELIVVFFKDQWKKTGGSRVSDISREEFKEWTYGLWTFHGESKTRIGHPTPFPQELPRRAIKLFSFVGDTVFDPFAGSATTMIAASQLKRKAVGVEISLDYCKLATTRIQKELEDQSMYPFA